MSTPQPETSQSVDGPAGIRAVRGGKIVAELDSPQFPQNAEKPHIPAFPSIDNEERAVSGGLVKVVIILGSKSDLDFMQPARNYLGEQGVALEERVLSAHRNLDELLEYLGVLDASGERFVILAVAGLSAALPGVVAVKPELPCIGVPVPGGPLNGIDALLAISQVPGQVPCGTVGLHSKAPLNAAMLAHRILKLANLS